MTTKALFLLIRRRDGETLRSTNVDMDLNVTAGGIYTGTYSSSAAISITAIKSNSSLAVDNAEVSGGLSAVAMVDIRLNFTAEDVEGGVWDMARVRVFEADTDDLSAIRVLLIGPIGKIRRTFEGGYTCEVRNILQLVQQKIGETYSVTCRAILGSGVDSDDPTPIIKRCGVDLTAYEVAGSITSINRDHFSWYDTSIISTDYPTGWFRDGIARWTSGANAGRRMQIRRHLDGGLIVLDEQAPYSFEVGDAYVLTPGCSHVMTYSPQKEYATTFAWNGISPVGDCKDKFNNLINMKAEATMPGMDAVLADLGSIDGN